MYFVLYRIGGNYILERVTGIEPAYRAWEASVLPLNYTRIRYFEFTTFANAS